MSTVQVKTGGSTAPPVAKHGHAQAKGLAASKCGAYGMSKATMNRYIARQIAIGDHLERLKGTSLEKFVEQDALCKLPALQREELIKRAIAGEKVSAKRFLAPDFYEVKLKSKDAQYMVWQLQLKLAVFKEICAESEHGQLLTQIGGNHG